MLFGRASKLLAIALLLLSLYGCKVELYTALPEQEGNEMLALLLQHGIDSEKQPGKDNTINLFIDENQTARAIQILSNHGYPKTRFTTIKDIFSGEGLVSTPFEERTRYIYGLSQEVSETLSQIDGVLVARVHVVLPEESSSNSSNQNKQIYPASASVFIKYNSDYDLDLYIPQMKSIVANAIEGLSYDQVSVSLFPARQETRTDFYPTEYRLVLGLEISPASVGHFYMLLIVLIGLVFAGISGSIYLYIDRQNQANKQQVAAEPVATNEEKTA
ncbi:MAG: type III secretion inner membrane ring lipoprotein SctJ [Chromatiales bacterium]|nr:type III secretion inner membrane ring lipoprotein SctJ [Chromatiales bacterium]